MPTDTAYTIKDLGPVTQAILNSPSRPALLTARRYKVLKRRLREYEKTLKQMTKALDSYDKQNEQWDRRTAKIQDRMSEAQERIMNNENLSDEDIQELSQRLAEKTTKKLKKVEESRVASNTAVDRAYQKLERLIDLRTDIDRLLNLPVNRYVPLNYTNTLVRPLKTASSKIAKWSAFWKSKLTRDSQKKRAYKEEYKMRKAFKDLDEKELEQADQKIREKNEMSQDAKMTRLDQFFHENAQDNLQNIIDVSLKKSGKKKNLMNKAEGIDEQNRKAQESLEKLREKQAEDGPRVFNAGESQSSAAGKNVNDVAAAFELGNHSSGPHSEQIPPEPDNKQEEEIGGEGLAPNPHPEPNSPEPDNKQEEEIGGEGLAPNPHPEPNSPEPDGTLQGELQTKEAEVRKLLGQVNEETVANSGIKKENQELKQKSDSLQQEEDRLKKEIAEKQAEEARIREEAERYRKAADARMKNLSQMQEILQMRIHDLHEEKKALAAENEELAGLINSRQQDIEVAKQERQVAQQSVLAAADDRDKERLREEQATASYQQLLAEFKKYNIELPFGPQRGQQPLNQGGTLGNGGQTGDLNDGYELDPPSRMR